MGNRANLVIVRDAAWQLHYDHWCAITLHNHLFWGPELATQFVESTARVDDPDEWLHDPWCEGACVIDHDNRVLLWFGGDILTVDVPLRRAFLSLLQRQWPHWRVAWAHGGIEEIRAYVGDPGAPVTHRDPPSDWERFGLSDPNRPETSLMTVRSDGRTTAVRLGGCLSGLVVGESCLPELLSLPRQAHLLWEGEFPTTGLHIDLDARALYGWSAEGSQGVAERVAAAWPRWTYHPLQDRYELHEAMAQGAFSLPVTGTIELQRRLIDQLRGQVTLGGRNPARDLAERMAREEGREPLGGVQLGSRSDMAAGSVGDEADKLDILDALAATLS